MGFPFVEQRPDQREEFPSATLAFDIRADRAPQGKGAGHEIAGMEKRKKQPFMRRSQEGLPVSLPVKGQPPGRGIQEPPGKHAQQSVGVDEPGPVPREPEGRRPLPFLIRQQGGVPFARRAPFRHKGVPDGYRGFQAVRPQAF